MNNGGGAAMCSTWWLPAPKLLVRITRREHLLGKFDRVERGHFYFARLFCGGIFLSALYNIFGFFNIYIKQILDNRCGCFTIT